jgi:hypothetical protein
MILKIYGEIGWPYSLLLLHLTALHWRGPVYTILDGLEVADKTIESSINLFVCSYSIKDDRSDLPVHRIKNSVLQTYVVSIKTAVFAGFVPAHIGRIA